MLTLMVEAPFLLIRAALPHMYRQKFGRVINISSVHGIRASEYKVAYVTAKHALEGLSKVTALEGGPHGVTSNCVNPGYVRTPLVTKQIADQARTHGIPEDQVVAEILLKESAIKRLVEPEEVAAAGRLAGLTRRRNGDRRVLHHGRRLERPMTDAPDVPQWQPTERDISDARVTDFARFVQQRTGAPMTDYQSLWQWSVDDPAAFWGALWEYFELGEPARSRARQRGDAGCAMVPRCAPELRRPDRRNARTDRPAILHVSEDGEVTELSWHELLGRTAAFAQTLRSHGVTAGDRVVGYLPNIPEAVIAFLGDREHRRHLERLRAGLFRQGRAGPARPARAGRPGHRRRLSVRRQVPRQARRRRAVLPGCRRPADASTGHRAGI